MDEQMVIIKSKRPLSQAALDALNNAPFVDLNAMTSEEIQAMWKKAPRLEWTKNGVVLIPADTDIPSTGNSQNRNPAAG